MSVPDWFCYPYCATGSVRSSTFAADSTVQARGCTTVPSRCGCGHTTWDATVCAHLFPTTPLTIRHAGKGGTLTTLTPHRNGPQVAAKSHYKILVSSGECPTSADVYGVWWNSQWIFRFHHHHSSTDGTGHHGPRAPANGSPPASLLAYHGRGE